MARRDRKVWNNSCLDLAARRGGICENVPGSSSRREEKEWRNGERDCYVSKSIVLQEYIMYRTDCFSDWLEILP
jgi:hypothetical protein